MSGGGPRPIWGPRRMGRAAVAGDRGDMTVLATISRPAVSHPTGSHPTTRPTRDGYVDLVRSTCVVVVVAWHWVMTTIDWRADGPHVGNPVPHLPLGWLLTWVLQPMPLFFLVGGHLHARSLARHRGRAQDWVAARLGGLVVPILPLLGVFAAAFALVSVVAPGRGFERALVLLVSPLWFLGVYAACVLLAPLSVRARIATPALLVAATAVLDHLRFGEGSAGPFGLATMITAWGAVHHLGVVGWDAVTLVGRRAAAVAVGGYALLALLVVLGPYAAEMVGVQGRPSNFSPATLPVIALGIAHLGVAGLVRPAALRILRRRPWINEAAGRLQRQAMAVFAWHLPAWGAAFGLLTFVAFPVPAEPTTSWWLTRPVWALLPLAILLGATRVRRLVRRPIG